MRIFFFPPLFFFDKLTLSSLIVVEKRVLHEKRSSKKYLCTFSTYCIRVHRRECPFINKEDDFLCI